jgi:hypothetical protein
MREYGKLQTQFWTSDDIRKLSDDGRMLAIYLLTGPHTTLIGCFRIPEGYVCSDIGWTVERVSEGFQNLCQNGFLTRDEVSRWVIIRKYLKWNEIENPNQAKAAIKLFRQIPESSGLKPIMAKVFSDYCPRISADELKPFNNPSETLSQPGTGAGTGTGTGAGTETPPAPSGAVCPHSEIIEIYHRVLPELPRVVKWTDDRAKHLRVCWRDESRQTLSWWEKYFHKIRDSDFLMGKSNGFRADLEWITTESHLLKICEGRYDNGGIGAQKTRGGGIRI